jgi:hypothetical protein
MTETARKELRSDAATEGHDGCPVVALSPGGARSAGASG